MLFPTKISFGRFGLNAVSMGLALFAASATVGSLNSAFAEQGKSAFGEESEKVTLHVTVDRAKVVRIAKPASTVIIGNPAIVDATIQDSRTLVLTGRSFGVTNLIILDADGDPIVDETVVVKGHETSTVRIYRRDVRQTLACAPICESTLTIGDDNSVFQSSERQIRARNRMAESQGR